jgi:hypothetical protein
MQFNYSHIHVFFPYISTQNFLCLPPFFSWKGPGLWYENNYAVIVSYLAHIRGIVRQFLYE